MPKARRENAAIELFAYWVNVFGQTPTTVVDVLRKAKHDTHLRRLVQAVSDGRPVAESGPMLGGMLRSARDRPLSGWSVTSENPRNASGDRLAARWTVVQTESARTPPMPPAIGDDDRLMNVLLRAQQERMITGAQSDRILALWLEV